MPRRDLAHHLALGVRHVHAGRRLVPSVCHDRPRRRSQISSVGSVATTIFGGFAGAGVDDGVLAEPACAISAGGCVDLASTGPWHPWRCTRACRRSGSTRRSSCPSPRRTRVLTTRSSSVFGIAHERRRRRRRPAARGISGHHHDLGRVVLQALDSSSSRSRRVARLARRRSSDNRDAGLRHETGEEDVHLLLLLLALSGQRELVTVMSRTMAVPGVAVGVHSPGEPEHAEDRFGLTPS